MAKRKTESVLGLAALPRHSTFSSSMNLALSNHHRAVSKQERAIYQNQHEHQIVIDAQGDKAIFGIEKMNEVKRAALTDAMYTLQFFEETKEETQLTHYQAAFDELSTRLVALSGRHTLGAVEVISNLMAEEISRPLYLLEEEPEEEEKPAPPKSLLVRLLGG